MRDNFLNGTVNSLTCVVMLRKFKIKTICVYTYIETPQKKWTKSQFRIHKYIQNIFNGL